MSNQSHGTAMEMHNVHPMRTKTGVISRSGPGHQHRRMETVGGLNLSNGSMNPLIQMGKVDKFKDTPKQAF